MSETCDRCGSSGEDRRTLWHACFYAMGELPVPFGKVRLWTVEDASVTPAANPRDGSETTGPAYPRTFHTLRVCKRCRAEWMAAITGWFKATPGGEDHDADEGPPSPVGSGIWVRDNGAIREITREEWDARVKAKGDAS